MLGIKLILVCNNPKHVEAVYYHKPAFDVAGYRLHMKYLTLTWVLSFWLVFVNIHLLDCLYAWSPGDKDIKVLPCVHEDPLGGKQS